MPKAISPKTKPQSGEKKFFTPVVIKIAIENNIEIDELINNLKNETFITDIIGRKINVIKSGQIYLKYYENGKTEKKINFK